MILDATINPRPEAHDTVFSRVLVDYAVRGVTRVQWFLQPHLRLPEPYWFQLQVNKNGGATDSWEDCGQPVFNDWLGYDHGQRLYGKAMRIVYRVVLLAADGKRYASGNAAVFGALQERDWLIAQEMIRTNLNRGRGHHRFEGYLFKRKIYGKSCPDCTDFNTGEVTNSDCGNCYGTGFVHGYFKATEHDMMLNMEPVVRNQQRDDSGQLGTVDNLVSSGTCVGLPLMQRFDVWVDRNSDRRYIVGPVKSVAELAQVPIFIQAELRLAPFSDSIYRLPLAGTP